MYAIAVTALVLSIYMYPTVNAACDLTKFAECAHNWTAGTDTEKCAALTTYTECLKTKVCAGGELDARVQDMVTHITTTLNVDCGGGENGAGLPSGDSALVLAITSFFLLLVCFHG
ncbi:hypothetical protein ACOMHN_055476 [Nucella lapillus]